jgi:hypothetical protein
MPIITTLTIYAPDGKTETLDANQAANKVRLDPAAWSFTKFPPPNWEFEPPRYRASREVRPSPKGRHRLEPPFSMSIDDGHVWQYGTRVIAAGEIIETREWPHPGFHPLNYSAEKVLEFFINRPKSRMTQSPWLGDRVRLSDGMSGPMIVNPTVAQLEPIKTVRASR